MQIERVLLTGAAGFLGQAILRELAEPLGNPNDPLREIVQLDLPGKALSEGPGLRALTGSVTDEALLARACEGVDAVIHAASLIDWGSVSPEAVRDVNVSGTEKVIRACRQAGVSALVYTSSMDVVCGTRPVVDADESRPYPKRFANLYSETKAAAEDFVLAANGETLVSRPGASAEAATLATCALRPCGMYGEEDPYHVANVLRVVRAGDLKARPGNGRARFQHVYVGNVAHAHVLAMRKLASGGAAVGGRSYFVTDDSPVENFLDFMEPIVEALGHSLPPKSRKVPYPVMFALGAGMELAAAVARPFKPFTPTLTRSSVRFVCHDHTFDGSRAVRELAYAPKYDYRESLERTIEWFRMEQGREPERSTSRP